MFTLVIEFAQISGQSTVQDQLGRECSHHPPPTVAIDANDSQYCAQCPASAAKRHNRITTKVVTSSIRVYV